MNLIQRHADTLLENHLDEYGEYKEFLSQVKAQLVDYKKTPHKIEFIERLKNQIKEEYDKHFEGCTEKDKKKCSANIYFENTLFFLQEYLEELERDIKPQDFSITERNKINEALLRIVNDLNELKVGQQITYDDLSKEFEELKSFYFLDKKSWTQLFAGKIMGMVTSGIISETVSKEIVIALTENYSKILSQ